VNRSYRTGNVTITGAQGGQLRTVDEATGSNPPRSASIAGNTVTLAPFAVAWFIPTTAV
jgi:hypothetical protein